MVGAVSTVSTEAHDVLRNDIAHRVFKIKMISQRSHPEVLILLLMVLYVSQCLAPWKHFLAVCALDLSVGTVVSMLSFLGHHGALVEIVTNEGLGRNRTS